MKTFFISFLAALASIFGISSHAVSVQTQTHSASTSPMTASSTAASAAAAQKIPPVITYPLGSDILVRGQTYNVTWKNESPGAVNYVINLEYVDNGLYFAQMRLGPVSSAQQTVSFKVPYDIQPRTNYQLYFYNAANNYDLVGSQAFTIK